MQVEFSDLIPIIVALISGGVLTGAARGVWQKFKGRIDREDRLERELDQAQSLVRALEVELHIARLRALDAGVNPDLLPPVRTYHSYQQKKEE